jgi:hypothetical protein
LDLDDETDPQEEYGPWGEGAGGEGEDEVMEGMEVDVEMEGAEEGVAAEGPVSMGFGGLAFRPK